MSSLSAVAQFEHLREGVLGSLLSRQNLTTGYWEYRTEQGAIEPTCLALLALRNHGEPLGTTHIRPIRGYRRSRTIQNTLERLAHEQNPNGSWSAFQGDDQTGCWTTALAAITLLQTSAPIDRLHRAIHWILDSCGHEASCFWRWRFKTVDNSVKFDPSLYGWSWVSGTTSWAIPTAFSLIALREAKRRDLNRSPGLIERIDIGVSMLLDRACPRGGWNAGNGMAFGVPFAPYIDATAIVLLALSEHKKEPGVRSSLDWLVERLPGCPSPYSLAWGILALAAYREMSGKVNETVGRATKELTALIEREVGTDDVCTLAICALALEAVGGDNVFEVRG
jgi:hypothetical protein